MSQTRADILEAIQDVIEAVDDTGAVLIEQRFADDPDEIIALIESQEPDHLPKGWLITWQQIRQEQGESLSGCEILQTLTYNLDFIYPYKRLPVAGKTSEEAFQLVIEAVMAALNVDRTLGLDNNVQHMFLQSSEPFSIGQAGKGKDARTLHLARFTLEVENTVFV